MQSKPNYPGTIKESQTILLNAGDEIWAHPVRQAPELDALVKRAEIYAKEEGTNGEALLILKGDAGERRWVYSASGRPMHSWQLVPGLTLRASGLPHLD